MFRHFKTQTLLRFSQALGPHDFRKAAATTMAIYAPQHIEAVLRCCGQKSQATRDEHYNVAGSFSASIQLNDVTQAIITGAKSSQRTRIRK
jgi:hypothetical protein